MLGPKTTGDLQADIMTRDVQRELDESVETYRNKTQERKTLVSYHAEGSNKVVQVSLDENERLNLRQVPGEFYEPDSKILEIIGDKTGFSLEELKNYGICTSSRSHKRRGTLAKNIEARDAQLFD